MKRWTKKFKALCVTIGIFSTQGLSAHGFHPLDYHLEDVTFEDYSTWQTIQVATKAGVKYSVERSQNLEDWEAIATFTGFGQEYSVPIFEKSPAIAQTPTSSTESNGDPHTIVNIYLNPSLSNPTQTVVRWVSLTGNTLVSFSIPQVLDPAWSLSPLVCEYSPETSFAYFILTSSTPFEPESSIAEEDFPEADQEFLEAFQADFPTLNTLVADSQAGHSFLPERPTTPPGPRSFVRITTDWTIDTDGDGIEDWIEFELAQDPSHPSHEYASVLSFDSNDDGIPDNEQIDSDEDGIVDAFDISKTDLAIDWSNSPDHASPRYAAFHIPSPVGENEEVGPEPLCTNQYGDVLFLNSYFRNGVLHPLTQTTELISGCAALGMNDQGVIIGLGLTDLNLLQSESESSSESGSSSGDSSFSGNGSFATFETVVVIWPNFEADPVPAYIEQSQELILADPIWDLENEYPPDNLIDKQLRFFANIQDENNNTIRTPWTFNSDTGEISFTEAEDPNLSYLADEGLTWGLSDGKTIIRGIAGNKAIPSPIKRFGFRPETQETAFDGGQLIVPKDNSWIRSSNTALDALDGSSLGVFCSDHTTIWNNGNSEYFANQTDRMETHESAPLLNYFWARIRFTDSSPNGWLLGKNAASANETSIPTLISMPVIVTSPQKAAGVDNYSPTSNTPRRNSNGRYWVSIPIGGSTDVIIQCPASPENPIDFENPNGILPKKVTLTQPETAIALSTTLTSAQELSPGFRIGTNSAISLPIGYKIMEPHTLKVTVWHVGLSGINNNGQSFEDGPEIVFTKEELEEALNKIFQPQINTTVEVKIENPVNFDWDITPKNGLFDVQGSIGRTAEQSARSR